jgi:diguanylate cyclase (GGDEF)-like protein
MVQRTVHSLIDHWLARGVLRIRLRFPGPLEQLFEAETGPERCRGLSMVGALACLVGLFLYRALLSELPDVAPLSTTLYLHTALPIGALAVVLMRLDPTPGMREGTQCFANVFCASCVTYLFAASEHTNHALYVAAEMLLIIYATLGIQLRFGFAVLATTSILACYGWGLSSMAMSAGVRINLLLLASLAGGCALLASWRLEYSLRRNYLLMLSERLRRQDLSARNRELNLLTRVDPLTGLANRRAYETWLANAWAEALPEAGLVGLVVLDIDKFKPYNDFYGHAAGDMCLQKVARCLRDQLRGTSDLVARLGGEEFAVLLPGLPLDVCGDIAERMRGAVRAMELPHLGIGPGGLVTVSAGVACFAATPGGVPEQVFQAADDALYEAKESGRNRVCLAGPPGPLNPAPFPAAFSPPGKPDSVRRALH